MSAPAAAFQLLTRDVFMKGRNTNCTLVVWPVFLKTVVAQWSMMSGLNVMPSLNRYTFVAGWPGLPNRVQVASLRQPSVVTRRSPKRWLWPTTPAVFRIVLLLKLPPAMPDLSAATWPSTMFSVWGV